MKSMFCFLLLTESIENTNVRVSALVAFSSTRSVWDWVRNLQLLTLAAVTL